MTHSGCRRARTNLQNERGTILISSLAIIIILLTIFLAALSYGLTRYGTHIRDRNALLATNLAEAGINRGLDRLNNEGHFSDTLIVETPNGGRYQTSVRAWGPYWLITSDGDYANQTVQATAIIGSAPPDQFEAAITACNENYPLVAAGHTRIYGDVNTGPLGLNQGRIKGEGRRKQEFHWGEVRILENLEIPSLDTTVLNRYRAHVQSGRLNPTTIISGSLEISLDSREPIREGTIQIENNLAIRDYASEAAGVIHSLFVGGYVEIGGTCRISGLVEIVAEGPIHLTDSSVLDNVLLVSSDSIVISGDATFSGIAISTKSIEVKENARLAYPSLLLLDFAENESDEKPELRLTSRGDLESLCFVVFNREDRSRPRSLLYLDSTSSFTGFLVSQADADLRGSVRGSVVTEQFHYSLPPTTYINWIRDLFIHRQGLGFSPILPVLEKSRVTDQYAIMRLDIAL